MKNEATPNGRSELSHNNIKWLLKSAGELRISAQSIRRESQLECLMSSQRSKSRRAKSSGSGHTSPNDSASFHGSPQPTTSWIFISHSSKDRKWADELHTRLARRKFKHVFLSYHPEHGIPAGADWEGEIYRQLKRCGAVIYLATTNSAQSKWCFAELALARSLQKPIFALRGQHRAQQSLLDDHQWIDFWTDQAESYERLWRGLEAHGLDPQASHVWSPERPPYPGLASFEEADAAVFWGRDAETQALYARISNSLAEGGERFVSIIEPSGSGKSSLVGAGLIPRLKGIGAPWVVVSPFMPEHDPIEMLARALAKSFAAAGAELSWSEIAKRIGKRHGLMSVARDLLDANGDGYNKLLLVIDQAEELVRAPTAGRNFAELLAGALTESNVLRAVATLRSEFLTAALHDTALAPLLYEPFLLAPLT